MQGCCQSCPSWSSDSFSLDKMAWCDVFDLIVEYGYQGQLLKRRLRQRRKWGQKQPQKKGGVWFGFIVEGYRSVGSVVAVVVVHSVGFYLVLQFFVSVNVFACSKESTKNTFFS